MILGGVSSALAADDGGTQSPFVIGVGAREQSLGRTGVAYSLTSEALFWNPARLAAVERPEVSLFRSKLFVDDTEYLAGFTAYPSLDFGTFAVGFQRISSTGIERIDERNRLLGSFDNSESNLLIGYGRSVASRVSLGGALRIAQQSVDVEGDIGIGLDLGVALHHHFENPLFEWVGVGANVQNAIQPRLKLKQEEVVDPRNLKIGTAFTGRRTQSHISWIATFDLDLPSTADVRAGVGVGVTYHDMVSLRAGVDDAHATFGLGVAYRNVRFDYALRADDELSRNDRFTLAVRFGAGVTTRRQVRLDEQQRLVSEELQRVLVEREEQERTRALAEADAAFDSGEFAEASRHYRRVLALNPDDEHAAMRVEAGEKQMRLRDADALLADAKLAQAASAYQSILERWPSEPRASEGLAEARNQLQRSADRDQELRGLFKEGLRLFTEGDLRGAESTLHELLRMEASHELGRELLERVQSTRAQLAEESLAKAKALAESGRFHAALRELENTRRLRGNDSGLGALVAQWESERAALEHARGESLASATIPEDRAPEPLRRRPLTAEEKRGLERLHREGLDAFSNGEWEQATRIWRAVWLEDPNFEDVSTYLAKAYLLKVVELYGRGQYEEALGRCDAVLEVDPSNEKARRYVERIREEQLEIERIGRSPE
jgi:tetratricopeptide (TPR) repeat protein